MGKADPDKHHVEDNYGLLGALAFVAPLIIGGITLGLYHHCHPKSASGEVFVYWLIVTFLCAFILSLVGAGVGRKRAREMADEEPESPELDRGAGGMGEDAETDIAPKQDGDTTATPKKIANRRSRLKSDPPTTLDRVCAVIIDRKGGDLECSDPYKIRGTDRLIEELYCDSLDCVDLMIGLKDEFEIQIPDEDYDSWRTVGQIVDYIDRRLAERQ